MHEQTPSVRNQSFFLAYRSDLCHVYAKAPKKAKVGNVNLICWPGDNFLNLVTKTISRIRS